MKRGGEVANRPLIIGHDLPSAEIADRLRIILQHERRVFPLVSAPPKDLPLRIARIRGSRDSLCILLIALPDRALDVQFAIFDSNTLGAVDRFELDPTGSPAGVSLRILIELQLFAP